MIRCFILIFFISSSVAQEEVLPALPDWSGEDWQRWEQDDDLIADWFLQELDAHSEHTPLVEGFSWQQYEEQEAQEQKVRDIAPAMIDQFFAKKPSSFLIDPQHVLTRQEYRDQLSFLKYHDSDSLVKMYVFVFEGHQVLPVGWDAERLWMQHFRHDGPTALVFYFNGQPQRTQLHLSPELMRSVGMAEKGRALQSAMNHALIKSQPADQLDGFCLQLSIRLYWMQKAWQAGVIAPLEPDVPEFKTVPTNSLSHAFVQWWQKWGIVFSAMTAATFVTGTIHWMRLRRRSYRFPERVAESRLGAPFAGGAGAVLSFHQNRPR